MAFRSEEDEDQFDKVDPAVYRLSGGVSKPKPLYNDGLVQAISSLVEAGAKLLTSSSRESRDHERMLWELMAHGKRLIDVEVKRRERNSKKKR